MSLNFTRENLEILVINQLRRILNTDAACNRNRPIVKFLVQAVGSESEFSQGEFINSSDKSIKKSKPW